MILYTFRSSIVHKTLSLSLNILRIFNIIKKFGVLQRRKLQIHDFQVHDLVFGLICCFHPKIVGNFLFPYFHSLHAIRKWFCINYYRITFYSQILIIM